jgi:hypothetical protein
VAGAFLCSFAGGFEGLFWKICGFFAGVFVVRLWWIRGGLRLVDDCSVVG